MIDKNKIKEIAERYNLKVEEEYNGSGGLFIEDNQGNRREVSVEELFIDMIVPNSSIRTYKDGWCELKNRLENFLWDLEHSNADEQRINDTKHILKKMNDFEKNINLYNSIN